MYNDPLTIVSSKRTCYICHGEKPFVKNCGICVGHGFMRTDISGMWSAPGFLVCGGPSINKLPYQKLGERGIVSMAINNAGGHVPVSAWVFSDPQEKFHHGLYLDPKVMTFAPIPKLKKNFRIKENGQFRDGGKVKDCPNTFGFDRKTLLYPENFLKTDYAMWGYGGKQPQPKPFDTCLATMLLGIRLMCYLGCPRIYLLGVDFLRTLDAQYSFAQKANSSNTRYDHENQMLKSIRPYIEQEGIKIYNCNPESKCDAFEYKSFDEAYEDCKGLVREPFDLAGWYEKK